MRSIALTLAAFSLIGAAPPASGDLVVKIENLRSAKGLVRLCLTRNPDAFPDCARDPEAKTLSTPASSGTVRFSGVAPGRYAISLIHDENGNGKLDKVAIMPREGFGFSRNPAIRFGPPSFKEAVFAIERGTSEQVVKVRYLL